MPHATRLVHVTASLKVGGAADAALQPIKWTFWKVI
jgi:hypothetical protein